MKRKVKYKNFDRTLTVALFGDYSQNVPKPKRTQVKMYLCGVKIYSSEDKTYPSGVKTYPLCICITSICVQINRNYVFIILKIYETQGKVQKFRPCIDSCAVGGLQSKRTQTKMYPSQNVPSWSQNLLK